MAEPAIAYPPDLDRAGRAETELAQQMGEFFDDPLGYVMFAFPWGEGELTGYDGPDHWQQEYLEDLGKEIRQRKFNPQKPLPVDPVLMATASGHGIGKSALTGMLVCFILDTRPRSMGIITANTGEQLRTKTFAQIIKWRKLSTTAHWWETSSAEMWVRHKDNRDGWRIDALTWREHKSEAFAGLHAANSTPFYIFDEGSAIPDVIYEVSQGGLTDGEPMHFVFGNPTRNSGAFFECFHKNRHRWKCRQIDSRDCTFPNKSLHAKWIEDHGEDSDFVRVRVRGLFPRAGSDQLIPNDVVRDAVVRDIPPQAFEDPMVLGVDVGRGLAESVIAPRRGADARTWKWYAKRLSDTMQLVGQITDTFDQLTVIGHEPAMIFIDEGGLGGPIVDRVRQLGYPVCGVLNPNLRQSNRYAKKDAQNWCRMREWLLARGCIPDDKILYDQLTQREWSPDGQNRILLERKEDMQERGLESPDRADALANTFDQIVMPRPPSGAEHRRKAKTEYDPYADEGD